MGLSWKLFPLLLQTIETHSGSEQEAETENRTSEDLLKEQSYLRSELYKTDFYIITDSRVMLRMRESNKSWPFCTKGEEITQLKLIGRKH